MLYGEWLSIWLENYVAPSTKIRTLTRYREIVEHHVSRKLGAYELTEITPCMIQCFVAELLKSGNLKNGRGLSSSSVNSIITVMQSSLKVAHSVGESEKYVGDSIIRPKPSEKTVECFTASEQKRIERYIVESDNARLFGVLLCLYTGLRIGELLALEWDDVDMKRHEIRVSKSCHYQKGSDGAFSRVIDTPKTRSSHRTIPIPRQMIPYLSSLKKKSRSTHVVSNGEKLISTRSYQRSFSLLLHRLGIEHRGFHSLRHTFATRALECGMDVKTLSELLGHRSAAVTLSRYVHSSMEHKREMMNKLGRML